jgi:hypothetical protein
MAILYHYIFLYTSLTALFLSGIARRHQKMYDMRNRGGVSPCIRVIIIFLRDSINYKRPDSM